MRIDENYSIENDSNQWTLKYSQEGEINKKTGKPTLTENRWYFGTLKGCLNRYLDESIKPAENIDLVVKLLSSAERNIENLIAGLK